MRKFLKVGIFTYIIILILSLFYVAYSLINKDTQQNSSLVLNIPKIDYQRSHSLIYLDCKENEFLDFLTFVQNNSLDKQKTYLQFFDHVLSNNPKSKFDPMVRENLEELKNYLDKEINLFKLSLDLFGDKDENLSLLNNLEFEEFIFVNSNEFAMFEIGLVFYTYKNCLYTDISNQQALLEYSIPKDFKFLTNTIGINDNNSFQIDETAIGSRLTGSGTIVDLGKCEENGHINNDCYRLSVLNNTSLINILTKNLNINDQLKFKSGTNIRYYHCILSEVDNPRGIAGYQWESFIEQSSPAVMEAIANGLSTLAVTGDTTTAGLSAGSELLSKIQMPEYVYSLTCEINLSYIDVI